MFYPVLLKHLAASAAVVFFLAAAGFVRAQEKSPEPELSAAGVRLADRSSARKFLSEYSPGYSDDGRPQYSFWNKFGNQVMTLTARSFEDPFFITRIEVFYAPQSYMGRHYVLKDRGFFVTENGIFIGYRQSAVSIIVGIPNVAREDRIGPNDIVRKKGAPTTRNKIDKKETITYQLKNIPLEIDGKSQQVDYFAQYETNKNKLRKFVFEISSEVWEEETEKQQ